MTDLDELERRIDEYMLLHEAMTAEEARELINLVRAKSARANRAEAELKAREEELTAICEAAGYVNRPEGQGGYDRVSGDRLAEEIREMQRRDGDHLELLGEAERKLWEAQAELKALRERVEALPRHIVNIYDIPVEGGLDSRRVDVVERVAVLAAMETKP